jgi:uncharacterized protein (UPF0548 family)
MDRRKTFSDTAVTYAAVGSTQAADVMVFPPAGFGSSHLEFRLGSGQDRFETASTALMTWGIPRGAGLDIVQVSEAAEQGYSGILFTEFGVPIAPEQSEADAVYAPDGSAYISAGDRIEVEGIFWPSRATSTYRVIYVIREERRIGYAWGTLDASPVVGEEFFGVEWREDDGVYSVVRSVSRVSLGRWSTIMSPLVRLRQWITRRQYVRSLLPARTA